MERMSFEEGSSTLAWEGASLSLEGPLRDAWRDAAHVFALAETLGPRRYELFIYDAESHGLLARIKPPEGWVFYRLTAHPRGPSVVASSLDPANAHQDWHFTIDVQGQTVTRSAPSR